MRLTQKEIEAIKKVAKEFNITFYLFGSRIDDSKKGGDIDLYIDKKLSLIDELNLRVRLKELLGDRKIDIVTSKEFEFVKKEGIKL